MREQSETNLHGLPRRQGVDELEPARGADESDRRSDWLTERLSSLRRRVAATAVLALALTAGCRFTAGTAPASEAPPPIEATTATVASPLLRAFPIQSLVIPMDTTYQDLGMLKAFGLVFKLLGQGVTVYWVINPAKAQGGIDFTTSATDFQTGSSITNHGYRGGPFVIDAADRAAAVPIIQAWHTAGNVTTVHDVTAQFSSEVARTMTAAPKIAVLADGNELIAFTNLNAAGITDSNGRAWPTSADATRVYATQCSGQPCDDVLDTSEVAGAAGVDRDGKLFKPDGTPAYCHITSMHYSVAPDAEMFREVRLFLDYGPVNHAFMQCAAITVFENAATGRYLTDLGVEDDSSSNPNPLKLWTPANPFAQFDGALVADTGSVNSLGLAAGSSFRGTTKATVMIEEDRGQSTPNNIQMFWVTGHLDGNASKGQVTYLTGHNYHTFVSGQGLVPAVPISSYSQTNGVRLFLNSFFESPCVTEVGQPTPSVTKSAPAYVTGNQITFTIDYANAGPGVAENAVIFDTLPMGTTFVTANPLPSPNPPVGGVATWNLGNLTDGQSGQITLTVSVTSDGSYNNQAVMSYRVGQTQKSLNSNITTTVRDATAPDTSITAQPAAVSSSTSATFQFTGTDANGPLTFQCKLDSGAIASCTSPQSYTGLAEGSHTFDVYAVDAGGTADATPATYTWTVDTVAPDTSIVSAPPSQTVNTNATFDFDSNESPVTYECKLDGAAAFTTCTDTLTLAGLALGAHTLEVRAKDAGGNVDLTPATHTWTVLAKTDKPVVTAPLVAGATSVAGTSEANASVEVFVDGTSVGASPANGSGAWNLTGIVALVAGQSVRAVATAPGKGASDLSDAVIVGTKTLTPVVSVPIAGGATSVSGTSEANASVQVFVNGSSVGTVNANGSGAWTITGLTPLEVGQQVTAIATASGKEPSDLSAPATVLAKTEKPVVLAPLVEGEMAISGTSETDAIVHLFVDGILAGSTIASATSWTATGIAPLMTGQVVTAVATAPGKAPSDASDGVTVLAKTAKPVVSTPLVEGATNASGTSEADASVVVFVDGTPVGSVTADGSGAWNLTGLTPLAPGQVVTARATAPGKGASDPSDPVIVGTKTQTPAVSAPIAEGATSVSGTSEANASVEVFVSGASVGTVVASGAGAWSLTGLPPLTAGQVVTAVATFSGKEPSDPSAPVTVLAKTAKPVVTAPIAEGATSVAGTSSEADGTVVEVFVNGASVGMNTVASNAWTLSGLSALVAGQQVTAVATATGKAASDPSSTVTVLAKTTPPTVNPGLLPGGTTVSGTVEPGSTVEVFVGGSSVGTTTAGTDGSWTVTGVGPWAGGDSVTAVATAPGKAQSDPSEPVVVPFRTDRPVVSVPLNHGATSVSGTSTEADGTTVEVFIDGTSVGMNTVSSGSWTLALTGPLVAGQDVRAQATASGELPSLLSFPVIVRDISKAPTVASPLVAGETQVRGTSVEADGTVIEVFVSGQPAGTATVSRGAWTVTVGSPLAAGDVVTARATAPGEATSPDSNPVTVAADVTQISAAPTIATPVRAGATAVSGATSEADGTVIHLFVDDQLVGTAVASGGNWTVTGLTPLVGGQVVSATATAAGKGTSAPSLAVSVEGATRAPTVGSPILAGATSVTGTSVEPDATVIEVFVDGQTKGSTTVSGGTWTLSGLTALVAGEKVHATATAPGLETSPSSNVVTVAADSATVSAAPTVTGPIPVGATSVSGTSTEADGTLIQLFVDGLPAGTATVAGGMWTVAGVPALAGGQVVTATATAPGKGTSAPSAAMVVGAVSAAPSVDSPLTGGDITVRGQSTEPPGTAIQVRLDGSIVATTSVLGDGTWSATVLPLAVGQRVAARATAPGKATSPDGNEVIVTSETAAQTGSPQVNADLTAGDTSVGGSSTEVDGTLIEVYVEGQLAGRATVSGGTWSAIVPALAAGQVVTAVATADGKTASEPSAGVTVRGRSAAPVLSAPISTGATSVSGTSTEAPGTVVDVYVNGGLEGTTTVAAGGTWTLSGLSPLATGDTVDAVATAVGEAPSVPSNSVVVSPQAGRSDPPTVSGPVLAGTTTVSGTSTEGPGTRIDLFVDGAFLGTTTLDPDGTWTVGGLPPLAQGSSVTATATAPGEGTSEPSAAQIVTTRSAPPAITGTLGEGDTVVTGTSVEASGTVITVYVDGSPVGTATVQPGGTWEATVPVLTTGAEVTAVAEAPTKAPSEPSAPVTVLQRTTPPVVQAPLAHGDTVIQGTVEQAGAVVTVYVNGQPVGTVTAVGNTWTLSGIDELVGGDVVTARALAPGRALSDVSTPVTVFGRTAAPVVVGPVVEGDTSVSGTAADGAVVEVYVNGILVGTVTASGTTWSLGGLGPFAVGQTITAVARATPLGPSVPSDPLVVIRRTAAPSVDPLGDGDKQVTGTSGEPNGTVIIVYVDGVPVASATVEEGKWSAEVPTLAEGSSVTATAQAPGAGTSLPSDPSVVRRRTESPAISGPVLPGEGRVVGTSNEPAGTEVEVFIDGESVGTGTVQSDGTWIVTVDNLPRGGRVTAVATAEGAAPSLPSQPWVVGEVGPVDEDFPFRVTGGGCDAAGGGGAGSGLVLLLLAGWFALRRRRVR